MKHILPPLATLPALVVALVAALPAFAHPGHGAPPDHAWFEHAAVPAAVIVAILALLAWGTLRRRRGVLPLAIAIVVALGFGSAGGGLPL